MKKIFMNMYGYSESEVSSVNLKEEFKKNIVDLIVQKQQTDLFCGPTRYGFSSEESYQRFLKDPVVVLEIKSKVQLPPNRMSQELYEKIEVLHKNYINFLEDNYKKNNTRTQMPDEILTSLFPLFEFFKQLSDKDIKVLNEGYLSDFESYSHGNSMIQFREDLNNLDISSFEEKYAGCFNGMMENVIGVIIGKEQFYRFLESC